MFWLSCIISNLLLASSLGLMASFVQRWLQLPALARILWILALLKLVTPPLLSVPLGATPRFLACALGVCSCGVHGPTPSIFRETLPWVLLAAWSAGAGVTGWNAWRRWARFQGLLAHAHAAPAEWQSLATRLAAELSIRRRPEILAAPGRLPPLVVPSWRRPRVLLPIDLMGRLNQSQRTAVLMHELVHIKRCDHLVRLLELAVSVAFWWLPGVVGSIGRQLRACEEACCDATVVARLPLARREYAELLLDVLDFSNSFPRKALPQVTAMSSFRDIEQRLRAILDATPAARRRWPAGALALGLACAILPCDLRYDFVGRSAAPSAALEPAAAVARSRSDNCGIDPNVALLCCPR